MTIRNPYFLVLWKLFEFFNPFCYCHQVSVRIGLLQGITETFGVSLCQFFKCPQTLF